jgi:hypothetical protein
VDPKVQDVVFNDLLQNSPCPDVCYAYGGSQAIDMTNVDANVISMGNFVNQCNYDGNSATVNTDPFVLPALLMNGFQFDVPQGYKGSLTFNILNSEIDVSSVASSKTVAIFTDIPQYISVTQDVTLLYKYSYTQITPAAPGQHDSISVTLSVNAESQNPSYYQMNMYLQDSNLGSMRIPITLNIFSTLSNPTSESNWPRACAFYTDSVTNNWTEAKCHAVDCSFGSNSVLTNAVKPPNCDGGGLQAINFPGFFGVNRGLLSTGDVTQDGTPYVTRVSRAVLPITNYPEQTNTLFNSSDLTAFGLGRLLDTHVQLFGPSQPQPFHRTNPRFNIVG